ncbi:hypothetical protein C0991_001606 [Blastosporella zonata]|nr:hypothetical protein C0991_001606 [Blastosporella zonata]
MDSGVLPYGRALSVKIASLFRETALAKRDTWPSITEARREISSQSAYRTFVPAALESFLENALRPVDDSGAVTLACSKVQEGAYFGATEMIMVPAQALIDICKEDKLPIHLILSLSDEFK